MELKEFIENTLVDIVEGVKSAQERCNTQDVQISPGKVENGTYSKDYGIQKVEFNVVLGMDTGNEKTSKGALQVILSNIGIGISSDDVNMHRNSEQTTVHFTVPIKLPTKK
ncbi:hypothetical protein [Phocaeicola sp.]